jgi:pimeloyl-ACP methyl ester carboxylesterase
MHSFTDGTQLAFYTTTQTTRDIDFIRTQLGIMQLNVYGVSYGTRVAQQYAMHFPNATRSVILDSAITNELALSQDHAINLDQALIQQFSRCQANADCKTHLGDTAQKMMTLKAQLAQPKTITFSDPWDQSSRSLTLSAAQFAQTIRFLSYNPDSAELIPYLVDEAYKGHWQPMATLMTLVGKSLAPIGRNDILELSVLCAEDADHLVLQPKDQSTLLGQSMVERLKKICTRWPKGTKPADFNAPFTGNIPTLILAGSDDPVTPVRYAHEIAAHLNHAKVIEFKGSGHTQVLSACGAPLIKKFLEQLNFSALPNACLDALGPPAPFQTINGPTP